MILTKEVEVKITRRNIDYWKSLDYDINLKGIIKVKPEHLSKGTHKRIDVKCDICGKEKDVSYQKYIKNVNNGGYYVCSSKCAQGKVKNTSMIKFGSEYYMQTKEYKERFENTCMEIYGVKHHSQNEKVKNKGKKTNIKKYGCENVFQNEDIKKKSKETCLEKYGCENVNYCPEIREKQKISNLLYNTKNALKKYKKYNIIKADYNKKLFYLKCDNEKNHIFKIDIGLFQNRKHIKTTICAICHPLNSHNASGMEIQLRKIISKYYKNKIVLNNRKIIGQDIDIYLPKLKLAFEFNGTFWHDERNKPNNYHINKTELCENQGIKLIHIFQDDWLYKNDIVKSRILNLLGKSQKIYARKCIIKEIEAKQAREFLNENHIQGYVGAKYKMGLFYNNELVSLMTFGKKRVFMNSTSKADEYELTRFCHKNGYSVIGGASRLFSYFIKTYNPVEIVSYADRSWSQGGLYEQLGFEFIDKTPPNYYYVVSGVRKHRYGFRKDVLVKQGYDKNKTEHEIMINRKIYRIYDSGSLKFLWKK